MVSMDHLAIMKKSWGLTERISEGTKTIESRWYMSRYPPWDRIRAGDVVYFKDSGMPVSIKARVAKVLQFGDLTPNRVMRLLGTYGKRDGIERSEVKRYFSLFKNKRYCILIFLKDIERIRPFNVNKAGFGAMASWITLGGIDRIKCKGGAEIFH